MGFAIVLKRKLDMSQLFLKSIYKSSGCVLKRKTMLPLGAKFSNPGSLLVSQVQLLQGGVSECRNKSLQLMFQLMGGGDKAGSGMDKIRAGWRAQHWRSRWRLMVSKAVRTCTWPSAPPPARCWAGMWPQAASSAPRPGVAGLAARMGVCARAGRSYGV
jgi:hypothetical protein